MTHETWMSSYVLAQMGCGDKWDRWAIFARVGLLLGSGPTRDVAREEARKALSDYAAAASPDTGPRDLNEELAAGSLIEEEIEEPKEDIDLDLADLIREEVALIHEEIDREDPRFEDLHDEVLAAANTIEDLRRQFLRIDSAAARSVAENLVLALGGLRVALRWRCPRCGHTGERSCARCDNEETFIQDQILERSRA